MSFDYKKWQSSVPGLGTEGALPYQKIGVTQPPDQPLAVELSIYGETLFGEAPYLGRMVAVLVYAHATSQAEVNSGTEYPYRKFKSNTVIRAGTDFSYRRG